MPLPASPNAISLSQVNTELSLTSTATISLNDTAVRSLAGVTGSGTTISMSNLHGKSAGSLVSPMVGVPNTSWSDSDTVYVSGNASARVTIWMTSDGQIWIEQGIGAPRNGAPTSAWWSAATYSFGGGVAGIGNSYWVRFTRTATAGSTSASTASTGWLALSTDRSVQVTANQSFGTNGVVSNSATYTIEVASTSAGGAPTSTTSGINISATADSVSGPEP